MAVIGLEPGSTARAASVPVHLLRRVPGALRLAVLATLGLAPARDLAEAGVAAPGHRGGVRHV